MAIVPAANLPKKRHWEYHGKIWSCRRVRDVLMLRPMTEPRQIATVTTYPGLVAALRTRVEELSASGETLDEVSGLPAGYVSKLLSPNPVRRVGMKSLGPLLGALGLALVVVEDEAAMARYGKRLIKRDERLVRVLAVRSGRGKHTLTSVRFLRKIASDGGDARAAKLGPRRRKQIARQAALVRWSEIKAAVSGTAKAASGDAMVGPKADSKKKAPAVKPGPKGVDQESRP